jgi:hypothetical protein
MRGLDQDRRRRSPPTKSSVMLSEEQEARVSESGARMIVTLLLNEGIEASYYEAVAVDVLRFQGLTMGLPSRVVQVLRPGVGGRPRGHLLDVVTAAPRGQEVNHRSAATRKIGKTTQSVIVQARVFSGAVIRICCRQTSPQFC